jgi:hypothetical protein
MSAGQDLANELLAQLEEWERTYVVHALSSELNGFLIGRFGRQHSRVALYNAADHFPCARPNRG